MGVGRSLLILADDTAGPRYPGIFEKLRKRSTCLILLMERAKGFEPSTPTLARSCSTPELHPHPFGQGGLDRLRDAMPNGGRVCNRGGSGCAAVPRRPWILARSPPRAPPQTCLPISTGSPPPPPP